jgi:hypothetical protein
LFFILWIGLSAKRNTKKEKKENSYHRGIYVRVYVETSCADI